MSNRIVAYTEPRRSAKSSTPSTRGAVTAGSGNARTSLSNVIRDTRTAIAAASRAPARPASASPTLTNNPNNPNNPTLRRRRRRVRFSTCSTNVRRAQSSLRQKNRRTASRIRTARPLTGRSTNCRW